MRERRNRMGEVWLFQHMKLISGSCEMGWDSGTNARTNQSLIISFTLICVTWANKKRSSENVNVGLTVKGSCIMINDLCDGLNLSWDHWHNLSFSAARLGLLRLGAFYDTAQLKSSSCTIRRNHNPKLVTEPYEPQDCILYPFTLADTFPWRVQATDNPITSSIITLYLRYHPCLKCLHDKRYSPSPYLNYI